jgi:hypothetical protein
LADEIDRQNEIRVWYDREAGAWHATIGPDDGRGFTSTGADPWQALMFFQLESRRDGWIFDPGWSPE